MTIRELIGEGQYVGHICHKNWNGLDYCSGPEYQKWLSVAIRFVEANYPGDVDTERFRRIAEHANGQPTSHLDTLIGILEAFDACPPVQRTPAQDTPVAKLPVEEVITQICSNFAKFDRSIQHRYASRPTITITDEHDLQNALEAILRLFVKDIRPEDYVPSYAAGCSRVDFHLPEYGIIIETKMASATLKDKDVGDQLIIDFQHYKALPHCNHLICFVYDKDSNLRNPHALISDLEKMSDSDLKMTVIISPI